MDNDLVDGQSYNNVYLLFVDAKGHSTFVLENDDQNVFRVFERFEEDVLRVAADCALRESCAIAQRWGWMGDGGLVVFHDASDGNARRAAIRTSKEVLAAVKVMSDWIDRDDRINGSIAVRVSIHKGSLQYRPEHGSIHSSALNLAAHAEKGAPTNSVVISEDVFRVSSVEEREHFRELRPPLEGKAFYCHWDDPRQPQEIEAEWRRNVLPGTPSDPFRSDVSPARLGIDAVFSQRASTAEYAEHLEVCTGEVLLMGVGLSGFVADHADLVRRRVLDRSVTMRVLMPRSEPIVGAGEGRLSIAAWRAPTAPAAADDELARSAAYFDDLAAGSGGVVEVRRYDALPAGALLALGGLVYFSPHLRAREGLKTFTMAVQKDALVGSQLLHHFEAVWRASDA